MFLHPVIKCLMISVCSSAIWASKTESRLYKKLFEYHDWVIRPVENDNETLLVEVGLSLRKLIKLCPVSATFEAIAWTTLKWTDFQLRWDPEKYNDITRLYVPTANHIFLPDIVPYNSATETYKGPHEQPNKAVIASDGTVLVVYPVKLEIDCPINDTQTEAICKIILGSWAYDASRIDLASGAFDIADGATVANNLWTVRGIEAFLIRSEYEVKPEVNERYVTITAVIKLTKNRVGVF